MYLMLYFIVACYVGWRMCFCVYLLQLNNAFGVQILWIYLACPAKVHITVQRIVLLRIPNPQPNPRILPESVQVRIRKSFVAVSDGFGSSVRESIFTY